MKKKYYFYNIKEESGYENSTQYKIFRQKFDFQRDDTNFNLVYEKTDYEDDMIEALFNNKVISEFMKDDNIPPKKIGNDEDFPINKKLPKQDLDDDISEKLSNSSFEEIRQRKKKDNMINGFSSDINKTKNIDDFIQENPELKKQNDNLNKFYDFALKSLKYLIPKFVKGNEDFNIMERISITY